MSYASFPAATQLPLTHCENNKMFSAGDHCNFHRQSVLARNYTLEEIILGVSSILLLYYITYLLLCSAYRAESIPSAGANSNSNKWSENLSGAPWAPELINNSAPSDLQIHLVYWVIKNWKKNKHLWDIKLKETIEQDLSVRYAS